ncbi:MAG TPA: DUF4112 domain-containing protein [Pyrinomonadaceae bacterium]
MVSSQWKFQDALEPIAKKKRLQPTGVENLERLGWLMDDLFRIPVLGWRFGLDAIIGLIPALGDTTTSLVSFYILVAAVRYRVPKVTLLRMGLNLAIDYIVGSLPLVGDLFDAFWKSNQMNVELLKDRAQVSGAEAKKGRASDWLFVGLIIFGLIFLALGSAALSIYILVEVSRLIVNPGS